MSTGTITPNTTQPQQPLFDTDDLIISTARYYMGRHTGMVSTFAAQLAYAWPHLNVYVQTIIKRDLQNAFNRDDLARKIRATDSTIDPTPLPLGYAVDRASWELVRSAWEKEATTPTIKPEPAPQLNLFMQEPHRPDYGLGHDEGAAAAGHAS